ncbi:MAG: aspartate aminotransferase family protein [Gammaproteobacteria bacterium]|nr:aspartate aminotransferase family protein [Gammaproteobacteria bacterium]
MQTYARLPAAFERGNGSWLVDMEGKRYLDGLTGIAVTGLGHAHPRVTAAISEQAGKILHSSNLYGVPNQERLADKLCAVSGMDRVFFGNSGAEANEAAIKIARLHGHARGVKKPTVVVTDESFHGRTLATLTATGNRKVQAGFDPLMPGFVRAPFNDIAAIERIAENEDEIVAILVEPIQGESGINISDDDYLPKLRAMCDARNWLLMLDEVQTGNGRTGTYFAYQQSGIMPDVVTTAKGLGNGVPIGACLARGAAANLMQPGNHGSTFGGNPLVCAAAIAVIDTIQDEGLCARATVLGNRILDALKAGLKGNNAIREVRGKGLMIAVEFTSDCTPLVRSALADGLLINVTHGNVVRLLPPLTMSDGEADELVNRLVGLINRA